MTPPSRAPPDIRCLRCIETSLQALPQSSDGITFFACPRCSRQYALKPGRNLTYRWLHPISLVLYGVIFEAHPLPRAKSVAQSFVRSKDPAAVKTMIAEIEEEIARPTQNVRDILDNVASEADCRAFLTAVAHELRASHPVDSDATA